MKGFKLILIEIFTIVVLSFFLIQINSFTIKKDRLNQINKISKVEGEITAEAATTQRSSINSDSDYFNELIKFLQSLL